VIKDNFETSDMPTTGGSLALATLAPKEDAFQVRKLREAGAVILGKTNLHELASGITSISSLGGQTRNPYDTSRNPGGSSGGTGAAVAASFAAAGMGSDTCGSIRIPAANNNLVGLRASLGASSRAGVIPLSHTQDVAGPLARSVRDLAILLDATVGPDPADPITAQAKQRLPASFEAALAENRLKGARIGVLKTLVGDAPEDEEVAAVIRRSLESMQKAGAETMEVEVPGLTELLRDSSVIDSEFKFDLADYLARAPGAPVRSLPEILERGLYDAALEGPLRRRAAVEQRDNEAYRKALVKRRATLELVLATLEEHRLTALVYPTLRRKPAPIGEPQRGSNCQLSASTGLPALSLPAGFTSDGLPVGVELLGGPWRDAELLSLAYSLERSAPQRRAPGATPPLKGGKPPAPVVLEVVAKGVDTQGLLRVRFSFDETTSTLSYTASVTGLPAADVLAASLHRGAADKNGAALQQLLGLGEGSGTGSLTLQPSDRDALRAGALYVRLYTRGSPLGAARAQVALR
jgi:Asp-tRNA(Asn)/Glu-tRNA(Gln) amidotransferase A subunit family amidase